MLLGKGLGQHLPGVPSFSFTSPRVHLQRQVQVMYLGAELVGLKPVLAGICMSSCARAQLRQRSFHGYRAPGRVSSCPTVSLYTDKPGVRSGWRARRWWRCSTALPSVKLGKVLIKLQPSNLVVLLGQQWWLSSQIGSSDCLFSSFSAVLSNMRRPSQTRQQSMLTCLTTPNLGMAQALLLTT